MDFRTMMIQEGDFELELELLIIYLVHMYIYVSCNKIVLRVLPTVFGQVKYISHQLSTNHH